MADQFSQILALLQQQNAKLEDLGTRMTELERQAQAESLGGAEASVLAAAVPEYRHEYRPGSSTFTRTYLHTWLYEWEYRAKWKLNEI